MNDSAIATLSSIKAACNSSTQTSITILIDAADSSNTTTELLLSNANLCLIQNYSYAPEF